MFVFIIAALTFSLIMIFGYKAINSFIESGEDVAFVQFKTQLESSIKKIYTEFGSVRRESFTLPSQYRQICFVDLEKEYDDSLCQQNQVACTAWKNNPGYENADENVFLQPSAPVKIKVYKISISSDTGKNYLCLPIKQGIFELILEGKGDRTELSSVPILGQ